MVELPNFHDGFFDGLWIAPNKIVHFFLRTVDDKTFTLTFQGVRAMCMSGVKAGNIILDLVFRDAPQITLADVEEVHDLGSNSKLGPTILASIRNQPQLQIMELNPSYGAQGLILFENYEVSETAWSPIPSA
jgi:hypothetical protein